MSSPFRAEALQAQQDAFLGTIRLGRPLGFAFITWGSIATAVGLIAFAVVGEVTRKARLPGLVVPALGMVQIAAPQMGVLTELKVREGDAVAGGQVLAMVSTDRNTLQGGAAELAMISLRQRRQALDAERVLAQRQAKERQQALRDRLRSTEEEERQAAGELEPAQQRVRLAKRALQRGEQLEKDGFVSEAQVQAYQESWLDARTRLRTAERVLTGLQRDAQSLRAELVASDTSLRTALAELDRNVAALEQERSENEARRQLAVIAPSEGVVTAVTVNVGQALQAGQTVLVVVPRSRDATLEAQLYAPSRTAGFVQPGQQVRLRYAAFPYQKFGMGHGEITSVSRTPIGPQDLPPGQASALLAAAHSNEPLYRISVKLMSQRIEAYGQAQELKPGMALEADVIQDRRAIWEWMLEPVLAVSAHAKVLDNPVKPKSKG